MEPKEPLSEELIHLVCRFVGGLTSPGGVERDDLRQEVLQRLLVWRGRSPDATGEECRKVAAGMVRLVLMEEVRRLRRGRRQSRIEGLERDVMAPESAIGLGGVEERDARVCLRSNPATWVTLVSGHMGDTCG